jgi:phospholipase/carboxylesterase
MRRSGHRLVLLVALLSGCTRAEGAPDRVLDIFVQGADRSSPLVVWLHGRGGSPDRFSDFWREFPGKIQVACLQGPLRAGDGWAWFEFPRGMGEADLDAVVGAAEEKLWPRIAEIARGRKVVVVGFSQGAMMAFALAARHPDAIRYAFPVSGFSPPGLWPRARAPAAPVYALHGSSDPVVEVGYARATVTGFKVAGAVAELREFPGVGHTMTAEMRADLMAHVRAAIPAAR